ncbi:PIG-L family deacetylase [Kitasatospora sp. MMS16-BH015]|uniref:PIG-L family deacetylase n=1 Tax=Kitasatospora sp. MMS16-BH015 TaxID=2018025 RepID=UPI000CA1DB1F|nr:PIG-L family deacetylase [Kitasatospora sp. MMS16-BH015]AUG77728.1 PIG-L family deacetylase [Kitasatospora sp. MMS16-BH015]
MRQLTGHCVDRTWTPGNRKRFTRRAVIGTWVAAVAATGVAAVRSLLPEDSAEHPVAATPSPSASTAPPPVPAEDWTGSYLQIIAHPDDDLYFMNPPIQRSIAKGAPVVTVVLTAAEADGRNVENDSPNTTVESDRPGYTEARHNGLRAAYALMATGDAHAAWRREVVKLADGALVELNTLAQQPAVQLYFFNLAQNLRGIDQTQDGTFVRLRVLWSGEVTAESTLPGTGSPIGQTQEFTRDRLIGCLVELLKKHRPTTVRTMDPDPEHDPSQPPITAGDHIDHTAAAQFAIAALQTYADGGATAPVVEYYRGYTSKFWPPNIGAKTVEEKREYLLPYAGLNIGSCPAHNCGDYQLGSDPAKTTHIVATAYRHTPTTDWLVNAGDGRLHAFAVLGGRVAHWSEQTPGGPGWRPVETLKTTGWMLPHLDVLVDPKGLIHLLGLRRTAGERGTVGLEVVHTAQQKVDGPFAAWESLGGPDAGNADHRVRRELGGPVGTLDAAGTLHVFARTYDHGLGHATQGSDGSWGNWETIAKGPFQDAPTALTTKAGVLHVFLPDANGLQRLQQDAPGGRFRQVKVSGAPAPAGAVTPIETADGRVAVYYREGGTGNVIGVSLPARTGDSQPRAIHFGGHEGTGELAVLPAKTGSDAPLVLHRNGYGTLTAATTGDSPAWADTAGPTVFAPALARDHAGRTVAAVIGTDGHLHIARQTADSTDAKLTGWLTLQ